MIVYRLALMAILTSLSGCITRNNPVRTGDGGDPPTRLTGDWVWSGRSDPEPTVPPGEAPPRRVSIAVDDRPQRVDEEVQEELDRQGMRPQERYATARVGVDGRPQHGGWILAHRDGKTYACIAVPNGGMFINQWSLTPGATPAEDELAINWASNAAHGSPGGPAEVYQRERK
jgi:hypothetical protein